MAPHFIDLKLIEAMLVRKSAFIVLSGVAAASAFQTVVSPSAFTRGNALMMSDTKTETSTLKTLLEKVRNIFKDAPKVKTDYDNVVLKKFPGALSNEDIATRVVSVLEKKGFTADNTLLCTSLCCDELARRLEDDFVKVYGNNFNLGGLSGFPFAGNTGFGAMAAHIPDNGSCLIIHGPHVGVSKSGVVGKVEREGIALVDNCCGSAIAASNYLKGITDGGAVISTKLQEFSDFQQGAVQELILPHGKRLADAADRMAELPMALYDSQDILMQDIIMTGAKGFKKNGGAVLGGIQINTAPDTLDYFLPLRFDLVNSKGQVVDNLLSEITTAWQD